MAGEGEINLVVLGSDHSHSWCRLIWFELDIFIEFILEIGLAAHFGFNYSLIAATIRFAFFYLCFQMFDTRFSDSILKNAVSFIYLYLQLNQFMLIFDFSLRLIEKEFNFI